ncbi:hypothetical protein CcarbDRAFT_3373 [Clostridium carboxidivorans P7]|uniref:Uncharacterized protein n=1 Tax=Clostridium carboxidivorans P7 TaxID=536227 RepID=C6PX56_9CLOT|nr:hypothetical protein [Clostridium carboxidivorans]EET86173.1 hypothetical protein CcarbDRAFT_3373 [Clostridium carboxidivorans P7]EFG90040.1 hypothetical protein CLCAR_0235 [Clostridium carboxidivorans P7]
MDLLDNEYIVITCSGGGIPVIINDEGVPAVIASLEKSPLAMKGESRIVIDL